MKIVVTTLRSSKGDEHQIDVMDGSRVLHSQIVKTIEQRDKIIWDLQQMYNVVDIDIKSSKQAKKHTQVKQEFRYSEIPTIPVLDEEEAIESFDNESVMVFDRIVKAVEEGLQTNLKTIRIFELNGTGTYLTSDRKDWEQGLQTALNYYISTEMYMKCAKIRDLIEKL